MPGKVGMGQPPPQQSNFKLDDFDKAAGQKMNGELVIKGGKLTKVNASGFVQTFSVFRRKVDAQQSRDLREALGRALANELSGQQKFLSGFLARIGLTQKGQANVDTPLSRREIKAIVTEAKELVKSQENFQKDNFYWATSDAQLAKEGFDRNRLNELVTSGGIAAKDLHEQYLEAKNANDDGQALKLFADQVRYRLDQHQAEENLLGALFPLKKGRYRFQSLCDAVIGKDGLLPPPARSLRHTDRGEVARIFMKACENVAASNQMKFDMAIYTAEKPRSAWLAEAEDFVAKCWAEARAIDADLAKVEQEIDEHVKTARDSASTDDKAMLKSLDNVAKIFKRNAGSLFMKTSSQMTAESRATCGENILKKVECMLSVITTDVGADLSPEAAESKRVAAYFAAEEISGEDFKELFAAAEGPGIKIDREKVAGYVGNAVVADLRKSNPTASLAELLLLAERSLSDRLDGLTSEVEFVARCMTATDKLSQWQEARNENSDSEKLAPEAIKVIEARYESAMKALVVKFNEIGFHTLSSDELANWVVDVANRHAMLISEVVAKAEKVENFLYDNGVKEGLGEFMYHTSSQTILINGKEEPFVTQEMRARFLDTLTKCNAELQTHYLEKGTFDDAFMKMKGEEVMDCVNELRSQRELSADNSKMQKLNARIAQFEGDIAVAQKEIQDRLSGFAMPKFATTRTLLAKYCPDPKTLFQGRLDKAVTESKTTFGEKPDLSLFSDTKGVEAEKKLGELLAKSVFSKEKFVADQITGMKAEWEKSCAVFVKGLDLIQGQLGDSVSPVYGLSLRIDYERTGDPAISEAFDAAIAKMRESAFSGADATAVEKIATEYLVTLRDRVMADNKKALGGLALTKAEAKERAEAAIRANGRFTEDQIIDQDRLAKLRDISARFARRKAEKLSQHAISVLMSGPTGKNAPSSAFLSYFAEKGFRELNNYESEKKHAVKGQEPQEPQHYMELKQLERLVEQKIAEDEDARTTLDNLYASCTRVAAQWVQDGLALHTPEEVLDTVMKSLDDFGAIMKDVKPKLSDAIGNALAGLNLETTGDMRADMNNDKLSAEVKDLIEARELDLMLDIVVAGGKQASGKVLGGEKLSAVAGEIATRIAVELRQTRVKGLVGDVKKQVMDALANSGLLKDNSGLAAFYEDVLAAWGADVEGNLAGKIVDGKMTPAIDSGFVKKSVNSFTKELTAVAEFQRKTGNCLAYMQKRASKIKDVKNSAEAQKLLKDLVTATTRKIFVDALFNDRKPLFNAGVVAQFTVSFAMAFGLDVAAADKVLDIGIPTRVWNGFTYD